MTEPFRMHEVTLAGPPRQRGRIHGEAMRPQILEALDAFGEAMGTATGVRPEPLFQDMFTDTGMLRSALKWVPELVEETRGIGEGAGIDFNTILAWQFVQEVPWYLVQRYPDMAPMLSCTALGSCPTDGPTILAQTADNPAFIFGRQTMLHMTDDRGIRSHILTFPGLVGAYGLNDRGIGVCINAMVQAMSYSLDGLGAPFVARGLLAQETFEDADSFIRAVPHATGNNFTVAGPHQVVAYECSAHKVEPYVPPETEPISYHTNHPLANDDRILFDAPDSVSSTITRFQTVQRRMRETEQPMTWQDARAILSSHDSDEWPICNHPGMEGRSVTCFGIIMETNPTITLHLSSGPPCCTEFRDFGFAGA